MRWQRRGGEWNEYAHLPPPRLTDHRDRVWFWDDSSIYIRDGDEWRAFANNYRLIVRDRKGTVWAVANDALIQWRDDHGLGYPLSETGVDSVRNILFDGSNTPWVIGEDERRRPMISRFDGDQWASIENAYLTDSVILESAADPVSGIWALIRTGPSRTYRLLHLQENGGESLPVDSNLITVFPPSIHVDAHGGIWLLSHDGLYSLDRQSGQGERIPGLYGDSALMCFEREGELWFTYTGITGGRSGTSRLKDGEWTHYELTINSAQPPLDDSQFIWRSEGHIYRICESSDWVPRRLTLPVNTQVISAVPLSEGEIWFGTSHGVLHYRCNVTPPKTRIHFQIQESFPHNRYLFNFEARSRFSPSDSIGETHLFSWRLNDGPWSPFETLPDNQLTLSDLPAGEHRIQARASDESFEIESDPATLDFTVSPIPIQSHPLFLPAVIGIFSALFGLTAFALYSSRKLRLYSTRLEHLVEQRTAELHRSEEIYRVTMSNISDAIFVTDNQGRLVFICPNLSNIFGYSLDDASEFNNISDLLGWNFLPQALSDEAIEISNIECEVRDKQGALHSILVNVKRVSILDGTLLFVCRDITQRKEAENQLYDSEERFRLAFENASIGKTLIRLDGSFISVNRAMCQMVGYTRQELLKQTIFDITHPDDVDISRSYLESILTADKDAYHFEKRYVHKDGRIIWVSVSSYLMRDPRGRPIYHIGDITDISERRVREQQLLEVKNLLEKTFSSLNEAVFIVEPETRTIVQCNDAVEDVFGYTPKELLGQTTQLLHIDEEHYEQFGQESMKVLEASGCFRIEYEMLHKEGKHILTENVVSILDEEKGWQAGVVSVVRDITARKILERQLIQSQKMESVGRLAGGIAHDFNNLLTAINGYSALMLHRMPKDSPFVRDLEQIQKAGERAAALTQQLLAFSRKQVMQPKTINLNRLMLDMNDMLRRLIGEDIELVMIPGENLYDIKADPNQIEQVLMNLVINSRDAMPQGGIITIETDNIQFDKTYAMTHFDVEEGDYVRLTVSDSGEGIPKENLKNIFEPFFTTKDKSKGTGLGLSTVYGIIKQSGGSIYVYSEPGEGATFKIYFPRVFTTARIEASPSRNAVSLRGDETILLVEDEELVRSLAARTLVEYGYTVLEASYGSEAIQIYQEHEGEIHLLLTDVVLPRMSGREVAERLTQLQPTLKVLYTSGYTDNAIVHHGMLEAGIAFMQKPFTRDVLLRKVRDILNE